MSFLDLDGFALGAVFAWIGSVVTDSSSRSGTDPNAVVIPMISRMEVDAATWRQRRRGQLVRTASRSD